MYSQFELQNTTEADRDYFIARYVHHNERLWDLYRQNQITKGRLRKARFELALRDVGVENKALAKRMGDVYLDQCPRKTRLMDGAIELLDALKGNYRMHILSNGFHETQLIKLRESKLEQYFDEVITSERASAKKPNPRIYDFAVKVTDARGNDNLMVGDNLEIDVKGAIDYGWEAVHFNPSKEQHDFPQIHNLKELLVWLGKRG